MPVPPTRGPGAARFFARAPAARNCASDRFGAAFLVPRGVLAPAVLRPVFRRAVDTRRLLAPLRADARAPALARWFDGGLFRPLLERFPEELPAFRRDAFLAMSFDPCR